MIRVKSNEDSEIVIALVCPLGTNVEMVLNELSTELNEYGYSSSVHRLSDFFAEVSGTDFSHLPFDERLDAAMTAGDELRVRWGRGDALALRAIADIVATRDEQSDEVINVGGDEAGDQSLAGYLGRHAYILRSLKTQDEVKMLRAVYGSRLFLVAAYAPDERRLDYLREEIRKSRHSNDPATWSYQPEALIDRDWAEEEQVHGGQDVVGTYQQADFFINAVDTDATRKDVIRTLEILFGHPFRTPTRDEFGQFAAQGAALRSSELGRQVGAAICGSSGAVIALGTNEVPKPGGGAFWEGDPGSEDSREFRFGKRDTNRVHQDELADELAESFTSDLLRRVEAASGKEAAERIAGSMEPLVPILRESIRGGALRSLTEFGRAVHAEMDALLDAARRGVSVAGATLYTSTFPCHNCARHIVAAGITRVVYVSPYAKSKAETLHSDALVVASAAPGERVSFEPFVGVAPRRYMVAFDAAARERLGHERRKDRDGYIPAGFDKHQAMPVISDLELEAVRLLIQPYRQREELALEHYEQMCSSMELSEAGDTKALGVQDASVSIDERRCGDGGSSSS
jgi:deoxycytidylate deaminase